MKFHRKILNSFQVTERTRVKRQILLFPTSKGHISKIRYPESRFFLYSAHRLMLVDIPMRFHHGVFNSFQDTEPTRLKCVFGYF